MQTSNYKDTLQIEYGANKEFFAVRIVSDDMKNAHIQRGAVVVVRKQRHAGNGEIVLVLYNGKVCFRYYQEIGGVRCLTAANNDILPVIVKATDDFAILGKVVEIRFEV